MTHSTVRPRALERSRSRHVVRCAAALVTIASLAGCGGSDGYTAAPAPPTTAATVNATPSLTFTPPTLTVDVGATVTFAFGSLQHNVFFDTQANAPADIAGNNVNVSVPRVFTTAGTYRYTCHIHPSMVGTVVVKAAGS